MGGFERVLKIDPSANVTTVAGAYGKGGYVDGTGGPSGTARFNSIQGVAVDSVGNVYVADQGNDRVRKIDAFGNVTTLAGNGTAGFRDGTAGPTGTAELSNLIDVAVDPFGNVYVDDFNNNAIRKIDINGNVSTMAGGRDSGYADGPGSTAELHGPDGIASDGVGDIYVADGYNQRIRVIHP